MKIFCKLLKTFDVDHHIVSFVFDYLPKFNIFEKNNLYRLSWHLDTIPSSAIQSALTAATKALKEKKDVLSAQDLVQVMNKVPALAAMDLPEDFTFLPSARMNASNKWRKVTDL